MSLLFYDEIDVTSAPELDSALFELSNLIPDKLNSSRDSNRIYLPICHNTVKQLHAESRKLCEACENMLIINNSKNLL